LRVRELLFAIRTAWPGFAFRPATLPAFVLLLMERRQPLQKAGPEGVGHCFEFALVALTLIVRGFTFSAFGSIS
jgi:hypothetical protein